MYAQSLVTTRPSPSASTKSATGEPLQTLIVRSMGLVQAKPAGPALASTKHLLALPSRKPHFCLSFLFLILSSLVLVMFSPQPIHALILMKVYTSASYSGCYPFPSPVHTITQTHVHILITVFSLEKRNEKGGIESFSLQFWLG